MSLSEAITILKTEKGICDLEISNCTATPDQVEFSAAVDIIIKFVDDAVCCLMRFSDH